MHQWRYYPVVKAVQEMRGVRLLVAVGVVAELGDLHRFDHRKLMAYLGFVPSEQSSGGKRHLGAITKSRKWPSKAFTDRGGAQLPLSG